MTIATFPFPSVNAGLNGASAVLLISGYLLIRARLVRAHVLCMLSAVVTSTVFLGFYITYHVYRVQHHILITRFPQSSPRPLYLAILISHTILAMAVVPLVIITLTFAARRQFHKHLRIARWTFPIWLYVSLTGVAVYYMLYILAPRLQAIH